MQRQHSSLVPDSLISFEDFWTKVPILTVNFSFVSFSFACGGDEGWAAPNMQSTQISLSKAQEIAQSEYNITIQKSRMQSKCSSTSEYEVKDLVSGQVIAEIPVPHVSENNDDGRDLLARVRQLMLTPREDLVSLRNARERYYEDVDALVQDLGVGSYVPNAMPITERISNNGQGYLVFVTIKNYCSEKSYASSHNISRNLMIKTLEYLPGRTDYSPSSIYQTGDLRKAILNNKEIYSALQAGVEESATYCSDDENYDGTRAFWREVKQRLFGDNTLALQTALERFNSTEGKPVSAYMLNQNKIAVLFYKLETTFEIRFGGTIEEMLQIQKVLVERGIRINKSSRLDSGGQFTVNSSIRKNRPLPASLRD